MRITHEKRERSHVHRISLILPTDYFRLGRSIGIGEAPPDQRPLAFVLIPDRLFTLRDLVHACITSKHCGVREQRMYLYYG